MVTFYTKTADGQREIATRARRLTPRARSLLILIDGKRADEELAALVPQFDETLPILLEAGLVATVSSEPTRSAATKPASAAPPGHSKGSDGRLRDAARRCRARRQ